MRTGKKESVLSEQVAHIAETVDIFGDPGLARRLRAIAGQVALLEAERELWKAKEADLRGVAEQWEFIAVGQHIREALDK